MQIKLKDNIPQLSIAIIVLSLFKQFLFYYHFNVPIRYYLGLQELGLLIASDLFIIIPILILFYFANNDTEQEKAVLMDGKRINIFMDAFLGLKTAFFQRKILKVLGYLLGITLMFLLPPIFSIYFIINPISYGVTLMCFGLLVVYLIFVLRKSNNKTFHRLIPFEKHQLLLLGIFGVYFIIESLILEISDAENGKFTGTKVFTSDNIYISSDSSFYIGQTSNYIFYFNKADSHSTVIPLSEVKRLEFYSKK